jgi:glycosyltransferase involved in cell wall biosynthesis
MRFHIVSLPHTQTTKEYCACAYTQKVLNFCKMMNALGHQVFHYGAQGSTVECTEHIDIISSEEQWSFFGNHDWKARGFSLGWNADLPYWKLTNLRASKEIRKRAKPGDFVCLIGGNCQKPIADALPDLIVTEPFVGYYGVFTKYRAFESYTHQSGVYAQLNQSPDGSIWDAVIPNYFDPADFPLCAEKGDYLLYVGRLIRRKGLDIAVAAAKASGRKLILVGQGAKEVTENSLTTGEGQQFPLGDGIEYVGYADVAKRAALMGHARALLAPTTYVEPFGGVVVEAQLCGTPVVTTDFGAFCENVNDGVTGFRCHSPEEFAAAVATGVDSLNPEQIREWAMSRYSLDVVALKFEKWFSRLATTITACQ